jgi:hypothetical protein
MGDTRDVARGRQTTGDLESGRKAFAARAWAAARDHFGRADPGTLTPVDWHSLATAASLVADRDSAIRAWQQAFTLHSTAGDRVAAAMDAQWIAHVHSTSGNVAVGGGWVARGLRLLEGEPEDAEPWGLLPDAPAEVAVELAGDIAGAAECGRQVLAIGQRWRNGDLTAFGPVSQGRMLIYSGQVPEGLTLLDEAMVGLAAGEVSPIGSGNIYCAMIEGCRWAGRPGGGGAPGRAGAAATCLEGVDRSLRPVRRGASTSANCDGLSRTPRRGVGTLRAGGCRTHLCRARDRTGQTRGGAAHEDRAAGWIDLVRSRC